MEVKKYYEFFSVEREDDEDKNEEISELAKEILITIDMFIDVINNQDDIKKLKEIESILKKYK